MGQICSLGCGMPFCQQRGWKETNCSISLRATLVALSILAIVAGALIVAEVPGISLIGTTAGWVFISLGISTIFIAVCLRCVKNNGDSVFSRGQTVVEPRISKNGKSSHSWSHTNAQGETVSERSTFCSLKKFLASEDSKVITTLLKEKFNIKNLNARLNKNFGTRNIDVAIPLHFQNQERNDGRLLKFLGLIFMTGEQILEISLEDLNDYDDDMKNILSYRLSMLTPPNAADCVEDTLGAFLNYGDEILTQEFPHELFVFLTNDQVQYFLETYENDIDFELVANLFPNDSHLFFIRKRADQILRELPIECLMKCISFLAGDQLMAVLAVRHSELSLDDIPDIDLDIVQEAFPMDLMSENESKKKMARLPIEVINLILPKMSYTQLRQLPTNHLKNKKLDLSTLSDEQVRDMFPTGFMDLNNSKRRCKQLAKQNRVYVKNKVNFFRDPFF